MAPVVATLVYSNCPDDVLEWVERVCQWNFKRVIPCHFDGPVEVRARPSSAETNTWSSCLCSCRL